MFLIAFRKLLTKLKNKRFRDAYVAAQNKHGIAYQIRMLREQRGLSQTALGELARKPANVISRLENPEYGKVNTQTLYELASAFDVAVLIRFVRFEEFLKATADLTPAAFAVPAFTDEIKDAQAELTLVEQTSGALRAAQPSNTNESLKLESAYAPRKFWPQRTSGTAAAAAAPTATATGHDIPFDVDVAAYLTTAGRGLRDRDDPLGSAGAKAISEHGQRLESARLR